MLEHAEEIFLHWHGSPQRRYGRNDLDAAFRAHCLGAFGEEIAAGHARQADEIVLVEAQRGLDSAHVHDVHGAR